MENEIKKLINNLSKRKKVNNVSVYNGKDIYWKVYLHVSGFIDNNYFAFTIFKKEELKIRYESTCDNVEEIKNYTKKLQKLISKITE